MESALRIGIADDEPRIREFLKRCLEAIGYRVVSAARTGRELVDHCREKRPELVISDVQMPELDGIEAAAEIYRIAPIPVILVSAFQNNEFVRRSTSRNVVGCLMKPVKVDDLRPAISISMQRFREYEETRKEAERLQQAMADRKLIERATNILMNRARLTERDALRQLQHLATSKRRKLNEIAHMVITTELTVFGRGTSMMSAAAHGLYDGFSTKWSCNEHFSACDG